MMSTSRFGRCQHLELDEVDIFCEIEGVLPTPTQGQFPKPDWLLFDDTGTYDAAICAKGNCNLECINKVIRYW